MNENAILEELLKELQYQRLEKENLLLMDFKSFFNKYASEIIAKDLRMFLDSFSNKIRITVQYAASADFILNLQNEIADILTTMREYEDDLNKDLEQLKIKDRNSSSPLIMFKDDTSAWSDILSGQNRPDDPELTRRRIDSQKFKISRFNENFSVIESFLKDNKLDGILLYLKLQALL
jgi:hypothetical protein